jgi:hypothetical protein
LLNVTLRNSVIMLANWIVVVWALRVALFGERMAKVTWISVPALGSIPRVLVKLRMYSGIERGGRRDAESSVDLLLGARVCSLVLGCLGGWSLVLELNWGGESGRLAFGYSARG